jgi:hypothetical protein
VTGVKSSAYYVGERRFTKKCVSLRRRGLKKVRRELYMEKELGLLGLPTQTYRVARGKRLGLVRVRSFKAVKRV